MEAPMIRKFVVATTALLAVATPSFAQSRSLTHQIADGQPWSMLMAEGRNGRLTLRPNGTGQMRAGPMEIEAIWREGPEGGLCVKPGIAPERCVILRQEGSAIVGMQQGKDVFRLTR